MTGGLATGLRSVSWVVCITVLVAGCGGVREADRRDVPTETPGAVRSIPVTGAESPLQTSTPSADLPTPSRADGRNATALSKAALTVMYSVDSTADTGLRDAKLRAARYLTAAYKTEVEAEPVQYVPQEWQRHRAYIAVDLEPIRREEGAPSDGPTTAYRQWQVRTTPTGRDGWRGDALKFVVFMELTRSSRHAPWRVSNASASDDN